ncbi:hypothetical protein BH10PSE1_BH10PSE1_08190 [soil metagenome]
MKLLNWIAGLLTPDRLITRKELVRLSPAALSRRSRRLAHAIFVGDAVLCRVLTRYRLYVAADDVGFGVHVMLDGVWETWLTAFMARRIRPGMRVVDVGANHGYYTLLFAHLTGVSGRVAAVEPHPRTAGLLRRSLYANGFQPWTTVFERAATAIDGQTLHLGVPDHEPKNAHVLAEARPGTFAIQGDRLATLLSDWPSVDFIKIDVEGAEEACLDGAWPIIERDRPQLVLEFNAVRCADPAGLLDRLTAVYGRIGVIERDGTVRPVLPGHLLAPGRTEDWMLFFQAR